MSSSQVEANKRKREKAAAAVGPASKKKKAAGGAAKGMSSLLDKWAAVRKQVVSRAVHMVHFARGVQYGKLNFSCTAGQGSSLLAIFVGELVVTCSPSTRHRMSGGELEVMDAPSARHRVFVGSPTQDLYVAAQAVMMGLSEVHEWWQSARNGQARRCWPCMQPVSQC